MVKISMVVAGAIWVGECKEALREEPVDKKEAMAKREVDMEEGSGEPVEVGMAEVTVETAVVPTRAQRGIAPCQYWSL